MHRHDRTDNDTVIRVDSQSQKEGTAVSALQRPSLYRNVLSNWASTGLHIAYSLVITPIVVRALDRELYGIWSFLNGLLAYSSLFYLGLGAALIRYIAHYHATGERQALNRLASVVFSIYAVIGLVCLACATAAAPLVPSMLAGPLTPGTTRAVIATAILLGARVLLGFVASVFTGILVAEGRYDLCNLVSMSGTVARFVLVPFVVRGSNPLLALAFLVVVTGAVETVAFAAVALRLDRSLRVRPVRPRAGELRLLYGFGFLAFLLQVSQRIISYSDTTVIGVILGASSVALYSLPLQLAEYARIAVYGIVSVLLPHLTALQARGHSGEMAHVYVRSVRIASFASAFLNVNLVFLGVPFLRLWVGPEFADAAPIVLLCLGAAGFLQSIATQSQTPFCLALNLLRFPVLVLAFEALANLVLSIALVRPMGIVGVAVATAVPALLGGTLFIPAYVARSIGVPVSRLVRQALIPSLALILTLSAVHLGMNAWWVPSSYVALISRAGATVLAAVPVGLILFPRAERDALVGVVRRILGSVRSCAASL